MNKYISFGLTFCFFIHIVTSGYCQMNSNQEKGECQPMYRFDGKKLVLTEQEWKERLTPEQFKILREKGTEKPFHNKYDHWKEKGIFVCAGCQLPLYSSEAKYDSGTGWPSFWEPICPNNVSYHDDASFLGLFKRIEVRCSRCDGHLGHVFDDGPPPTGKRYCMNSAALDFKPSTTTEQQ